METDITNAEFLTAIFGEYLDPEHDPRLHAWVCSHDYHFPEGQKAPGAIWTGRAWDGADVPGTGNTYFSIALLKHIAEKGAVLSTIKRRKANFGAMPCVMLDDLGTKADESLPVPPSWLIETSPGNHQAGYLFAEPIESVHDADVFLKAMAVSGRLTDPGGQNIARYARLPVGFNLKTKYRNEAGEPFAHRLVGWAPDRRYDWRGLAEGLGLDLEVHRPLGKSSKTRTPRDPGDRVFTPKAEQNPVIAALTARNLYRKPLGSGKHEVTCPWVSEHTDGIDSGTMYHEPDEHFIRGGFKCQHGHCAGRHINELLAFLDVPDCEAKHKPTFRMSGGTLHIAVRNAEVVMAETGKYFQQGGAIVTVMTPPGGETVARHIRKEALPFLLTGQASWMRLDGRKDDWVPIDAPPKVCAGLFDAPEYNYLPSLNAIARQPFLRPDGSVVSRPGYDSETGTFGAFDARLFTIDEYPSDADRDAALKRIMGLVCETSFAGEGDKSAALAAFLTAAVRPSLEVAPGFLVNAHQPGSGKSYLQEIAILFATDGSVASATLKANDDEMEKSILATLLQSPAAIRFDEAQTDILPIKFLVSALSSSSVSGRVLGQSKVISPSTRALCLFAGNNVQPVGDMLRRVVVCNLDARVENPESREFRHDPLTHLRAHRERYVADALTLIVAHNRRCRERIPCRPLNGFPRWDAWIRQTILELGLPDPCTSMFQVASTDPHHERLAELIRVWRECFGDSSKAARDAVKQAEVQKPLKDILLEVAGKNGEIDATKLGYWLRRNEGKVVSGRRLERDTAKTAFAKYAVRAMTVFSTGQQTPTTPIPGGEKHAQNSRTCRTNRTSPADVKICHDDVEVF